MIFGLWFASEVLSRRAPLLEQHPEWIRPGRRGGELRMELPQAREWFLDRVDDFVKNQGVGCYRQDGSARFGEEPPDRVGITESQQIARSPEPPAVRMHGQSMINLALQDKPAGDGDGNHGQPRGAEAGER